MMILQFIEHGNLRYFLSNNFKNNLWNNKMGWLRFISLDLHNLHELGYCHKDFHSGNILQSNNPFLSDFGLSGPSEVNFKNVTNVITAKIFMNYRLE